ncbi:uncharacterized protein LOC134530554 [Bacillus rossius redtenbacheri]|uniref:uncharacterized protein LOC134530554 n=1 Tax=Bacillus rossius redtenbacheri TaxID=93214 RepID=UPI002FDDB57F
MIAGKLAVASNRRTVSAPAGLDTMDSNMDLASDGATEARAAKSRRYIPELWREYPELGRSDTTLHPSYTNLALPYFAVCAQRYNKSYEDYQRLLRRSVDTTASLQRRALDGVRVQAIFSAPGPQLPQFRDPFTPPERRRLDELLREP